MTDERLAEIRAWITRGEAPPGHPVDDRDEAADLYVEVAGELLAEVDQLRGTGAGAGSEREAGPGEPATGGTPEPVDAGSRASGGEGRAWARCRCDGEPLAGSLCETGGGDVGGHRYRLHVTVITFSCANGCGARMGRFNSHAPEGVDPFGACPGHVEGATPGYPRCLGRSPRGERCELVDRHTGPCRDSLDVGPLADVE